MGKIKNIAEKRNIFSFLTIKIFYIIKFNLKREKKLFFYWLSENLFYIKIYISKTAPGFITFFGSKDIFKVLRKIKESFSSF